ncbi:MAG: lipopolysaccharide biosynthesis protein [Halobacteriaceae archaeon]
MSEDSQVSDAEREALLSIAHGAVVTGGGATLRQALSALTEFVLARGLGPVLYGVFAFGWRVVGLLLRFVTLGTMGTLQRDVPAFADEPTRRRRVAGLAYATTLATGAAIGLGMVLGADWLNAATVAHPEFPVAFRLFAAVALALGVLRIHVALLRAVGRAGPAVFLNRVLRPGVRLVTAAGALALGYSVAGVVAGLAAGTAALVVLAAPVVFERTGVRPTLRGAGAEARDFYDHAVPNALSGVGKLLQSRVDVLLIGALLTATAAGIYNVVLLFVAIGAIPLVAFNQLLPPVASGLYSDGDVETLDAVYTAVTRLIVTTTVPIVAVQLVFGRELLLLFGPSFGRGYLTLVVFLVGRLVGNAVGATGWLLLMTNHQYVRLALDWLLGLLNLVLSYLFVLEFGLVGAALGTSASLAVQNLIQVGFLLRLEGLYPFDATFLKPLGAGAAMAAAMAGLRTALAGPAAIVLGTAVGFVVFVAVLAALGVNPRDRFVARELAARYRAAAVDRLVALR